MKIEQIASMIFVLMLVMVVIPLAFADENNETDNNETEVENETEIDDDNETEVENETEIDDDEAEVENETEIDDDNETEVDEDTQEEISIMGNNYGAEIRLLQLEKAILKNIAKGNATITAFNNVNQDTSDLQLILDDLSSVLEQVKSTDPYSNTSVEDFVLYKKEAINLSQEFRKLANEMRSSLDKETLDALKAELKAIKEDQKHNLKELKEKIRNRVEEKNFKELGLLLGEDFEELREQIQNGNLTKVEIAKQVREIVSNMSQEQKKELYENAKQLNLKKEIQSRNFALQVENKVQERIKEQTEIRIQERIEAKNEFKAQIRTELSSSINGQRVQGNQAIVE